MSLHCRRKPKYAEKTQACTGWRCKVQGERWPWSIWGPSPGPSLREANRRRRRSKRKTWAEHDALLCAQKKNWSTRRVCGWPSGRPCPYVDGEVGGWSESIGLRQEAAEAQLTSAAAPHSWHNDKHNPASFHIQNRETNDSKYTHTHSLSLSKWTVLSFLSLEHTLNHTVTTMLRLRLSRN